ncbi:MAG: hypothetical protein HY834_01405 [Devosia nanyangense]|uniref:Uncharacterized protein n=1 Tax=Devosia nanyangense TaxID=1228055 RepID=A0A933L198_9HYPH|nr:hypothetical protein [Devosia nanyangense]
MTKTPSKSRRKAAAFTTATIVSFSLTLLGGGVAVLTGLVPLKNLSFGERVDVGALLFVMPVLALVLAVVFEVTRIALRSPELPEPRRQQAVRWSPGEREG